jgi:uncharacterized C2H2 Zn-finger protein
MQREEATLTMLRSPRTDGLLRCPRRGCDELLAGVRALTFHLHIHAVGMGAYTCVRCGGAFESARDLTRHACARHRARGAFFTLFFFQGSDFSYLPSLMRELPPSFFIVERLRRVVRAWTCLSSTGQNLEKQQQPQQQQQQQQQQLRHYKRNDDNNYY